MEFNPLLAGAEQCPQNKTPLPKKGYYIKVLTGTTNMTWLDSNGNLTLGCGLIAYPEFYGETGRNSFVIDLSGVVYKKDLGQISGKVISHFPDVESDGWIKCK